MNHSVINLPPRIYSYFSDLTKAQDMRRQYCLREPVRDWEDHPWALVESPDSSMLDIASRRAQNGDKPAARLPIEILKRIFLFADLSSIFRASAVCHWWRVAAVFQWNALAGKIWRLSVDGSSPELSQSDDTGPTEGQTVISRGESPDSHIKFQFQSLHDLLYTI